MRETLRIGISLAAMALSVASARAEELAAIDYTFERAKTENDNEDIRDMVRTALVA